MITMIMIMNDKIMIIDNKNIIDQVNSNYTM